MNAPKIMYVRPFADFAAQAKKLGFNLLVDIESPRMRRWPKETDEERLIGRVSMRIEPITLRAAEALRRISDDPLADGYECYTDYEVIDDVEGAVNDPHEVASQDTAIYILNAARKCLETMRRPR